MVPEPLIPLRPAGAGTPLYCVHPASGSAYSYLPLVQRLEADRPVYGIEAPGFDDEDEEALTSVEELAELYLSAIAAERPGEPIALLGWSMGGVIGYEMARRCGTPLLITVDTPVPMPEPMPTPESLLHRFAVDLTGADPFAEQRELDEALAGSAIDEDSIEDALAGLTAAGVISAELDLGTLTRRYAVHRANTIALHSYQPVGGHPGPMVTVKGTASPPDGMDWSGLCAEVTAETVPGDHYTMWQGDGLTALAAAVNRALLRT
ncbi:thioesterase domain-containing protein [Amycolatopsis magusensis]|uniref:Thioesterase domain-containing protein n=1 Tax=Amycolatopsis magusensis TaxID=882444 RepID=A0ABS4PZM3_9PSEU|nr:alpha/beta fold hydrolase [Amycolatopsis magusensis]MBP2184870.1 thioesterase domain-containing protein [Amycolatopsis magusensis]